MFSSSLELREPNGGSVEKCTLNRLDSIHSTNNWFDTPCALEQTRMVICMWTPELQTGKVVIYKFDLRTK